MIHALLLGLAMTAPRPPQIHLATPSPRQAAWQKLELVAFTHFGPNSFTNKEWGGGNEDPNLFNPTDFDARQWARVLKQAGFKGVVITAKHHDGFCLWPSKLSTHTVAQSKWRDGRGDVLKELSAACKAEGLKFGVYLSPWDRNHPAYGTPEYNKVFAAMLKEVLTQYGDVFEVWFDGANGEGPNGKKQVYDWPLFHETVRTYAPNAVMFSDAGPDIRWVGNENGIAPETCWATIDRDRYFPGTPLHKELGEGKPAGTHFVPAECDVSIRPGWFYHPEEDNRVKSGEQLFHLYEQSVGRNANMLLNIPPDRRGQIHPNDVKALMDFKRLRDKTYGKNLVADFDGSGPVGAKPPTATIDGKLKQPTLIDRVVLREDLSFGQRVSKFMIEGKTNAGWTTLANGTTVGHKRIVPVPATKVSALRVSLQDGLADPYVLGVEAYATPFAAAELLQRESQAEKDKRMAWFRDARFGMFIHWGVYSIPGGVYNGKKDSGAGEWILTNLQIPPKEYEALQPQFNPYNFDAKKWVKIAKDAGMKYIVITSKHHDGFGMWPSKQTDWNIGHTPFKRDPLKELADECKKQGIVFCLYHSIMDWRHPDYLPHRPWDTRSLPNSNMDRYVDYMKAQLKELLTNYGPIGIVWFDGEWEGTWNHERGADLYAYVRSLQPNTIVNNRVDKGRGGMGGMSDKGFAGDYGTPEQEIPANGLPGVDWESCMTMNGTWGYKSTDTNWKSAETLIRNLVDCASKGGNYLLNVGPTSLGEIPEASVERLAEVGKWTKVNGESVYGTHAGPFVRPLPWGRVTQKGNKLYLHVFDKDAASVELSGLRGQFVGAYRLDDKRPVSIALGGAGWPVVALGDRRPSADEVFVIETRGTLRVDKTIPKQAPDGTVRLEAGDASITGSLQFEADKKAIGYWTNAADTVTWEFDLSRPGEYNIRVEFACEDASEGSTFEVGGAGWGLQATVKSTGGWANFKSIDLGRAALVHPGATKITVKAVHLKGNALMNLRRIILTPAK